MKKLLLTLIAVLTLTSVAVAETYTLPAADQKWNSYTWNNVGDNIEGTVENFTLLLEKNTSSSTLVSPDQYSIRVYAGARLTITAPSGITFKSVVININTTGNKASAVTVSEGWTASAMADNKVTLTSETAQSSVTFDGAGKQLRVASLVIEGEGTPAPVKDPANLHFPQASYTVKLGEAFTAPALSRDTDAAPVYSSSNPEVATVEASTGTVTIVAAGTTVITAETAETEDFAAGKASYTLDVVDPNAPGATIDNPMTVAQALEACTAEGTKGVFVKGIITETKEWSAQYKNVDYYIADKADDTETLMVYRGKWGDIANKPADNQPEVGATVIVKGDLIFYGNKTKEFTSGSQIVSYDITGVVESVAAPTFDPEAGAVAKGTEVTIATATEGASIYYTLDGTEPTAASTLYSAPVVVNDALTIKAIAVKEGMKDSEVATASYVIKSDVSTTGAQFNFTDPSTLTPAYTLEQATDDGTTGNKLIDVKDVTFTKDGISLVTTGTGTAPRLYYQTKNEAWSYRIYKNSTLTISCSDSQSLVSIVFDTQTSSYATALGNATFSTGAYNKDEKTLSLGDGVKSVTITPGATIGFNGIAVNYSGTSAVSDIAVEEAEGEAVYYNLQGVRVANPENGLYIRVQGKKAVKVLVR